MEIYHISDVIGLLGLPQPLSGRSSYYISCPCCDDNPRKRHLNVNTAKDVFRCPRCGVAGGVIDLYSLYTGLPRDDAKVELANKLGQGCFIPSPPTVSLPQECPLTDISTRHETYSALLRMLSLAPDHRDNLLSRGLTEQEIIEYGYKTAPVIGLSALAKRLQENGFYIAGVPGFYRKGDGSWTFIGQDRGILIPVRNSAGQIQGLQLRRDDTSKRKYRWVSSAEKPDGCGAECWTHLRGPVGPSIILTEGPMKADVIYSLSGLTTLAVPGVNGLSHLRDTLLQLKSLGLQKVKTAFDMDYVSNYHVQTGYLNLYALLDDLELSYSTFLWDPRYKGLDDYIWEYLLRKRRET